jgi:cellobiose transport system permease protein
VINLLVTQRVVRDEGRRDAGTRREQRRAAASARRSLAARTEATAEPEPGPAPTDTTIDTREVPR